MRSLLALAVFFGGLYGIGFLLTANAANDLTDVIHAKQSQEMIELRLAGLSK